MKRLVLGMVVAAALGSTSQAMELARENGVIQIGLVSETGNSSRVARKIVTAALKKVGHKDRALDVSFSQVKTRALLLDPLLTAKVVDIGLTWQKPDCGKTHANKSEKSLCNRFFFSKPVFVEQGRVVTLKSGPLNRPMTELRICTVAGFSGPISGFGGHVRANDFDACFRLLASKQVDGVAGDQWRLRQAITKLNLADQLTTMRLPVYRRTYHAIIAKSHMRARTLLYYLNGGLKALGDSGELEMVLAKARNKRDGGKDTGEGE